MVSRAKLSDPIQRASAATIADRMSEVFLDLLRYEEPRKEANSIDLQLYWFCTLNFIQSILSGGISFFWQC
jgi:hypothetical protein